MDHFETIYTRRAADYHRMIVAEDVDGNTPCYWNNGDRKSLPGNKNLVGTKSVPSQIVHSYRPICAIFRWFPGGRSSHWQSGLQAPAGLAG